MKMFARIHFGHIVDVVVWTSLTDLDFCNILFLWLRMLTSYPDL